MASSDFQSIYEPSLMLPNMCDSLDAYFFAKDCEGKYLYANKKVQSLFGCSLNDIIGKDDSHFFDLALSKQILENDKKVFASKQQVVSEEHNFVRGEAAERVYRIIKSPLFDDKNEVIGLSGFAHDITDEKRQSIKKEADNLLLKTILDNLEAFVYMKDESRRFLYVNDKVANLFGLPPEQIIGQKEQDILPKETAEHFHKTDNLVIKQQRVLRTEETLSSNGQTYHYLSVKTPVTLSDKRSIIGFSTDVSEIYKLKEEFKHLANTDELTGIYNRRYFIVQSENAFCAFKRQHSDFSLVTFDIDYFKQVNDEFGHPVGDAVLKNLSNIVKALLRQEDTFSRIGGEEFAILLPYTNLQSAMVVAERLQAQLASEYVYTETLLKVTLSIGVTAFNESDDSFDAIFSRVDKALYLAKEQGRNRIVAL